MKYRIKIGAVEREVVMDGKGWAVSAVILAIIEQHLHGVPAAAISLEIGDKTLDPNGGIDVQLDKLRATKVIENLPVITVQIDQEMVAEEQRRITEASRPEALSTVHQGKVRFVRVNDKTRTDVASIRRLALSSRASRRCGFLWLSRRYCVAFGDKPVQWLREMEIASELLRK
ncbi:MAG: hypothetical protein ABSE91_01445 [Patescibacteria group bacterium]|jgi:hypothetical protein